MDIPTTRITKSAEETQAMGKALGLDFLKEKGREHFPGVLCLWGDLGSGKTTFVQGFAKGLGITTRLPSPTFIIVRRYEIQKISCWLYHLDLYRIRSEKEASDIDFAEMVSNPSTIIVIEWPERLGTLLPKKRIDIRCTYVGDDAREIWISGSDG